MYLVSKFSQHFWTDINFGGAEDDARIAGTVEYELVAAGLGDIFDGIIKQSETDASTERISSIVVSSLLNRPGNNITSSAKIAFQADDGMAVRFFRFLSDEDIFGIYEQYSLSDHIKEMLPYQESVLKELEKELIRRNISVIKKRGWKKFKS